MTITKTYSQYKKNSQRLESSLLITVDYDPKQGEVTQIVCVHALDNTSNLLIDLTAIFHETASIDLENIVGEIDWREVYAETMANRKEVFQGQ